MGRAVFAQRNGEKSSCCCFSDMWSATDFKYMRLEFAFGSLGQWERSRDAYRCGGILGLLWAPNRLRVWERFTLTLKTEEGLSDALLSCGSGLGSSQSWRIILVPHCFCRCFFWKELLRASVNPFLILLGPYRVILAQIFSCHFFL